MFAYRVVVNDNTNPKKLERPMPYSITELNPREILGLGA